MAFNEVRTTVASLYTTLRNITAEERFFGFLPPYGRRLAPGEEFTVFGDISAYFTRKGSSGERARRALENALDGNGGAPTLALSNGPAVHLFDPTRDRTRILTLVNNTLTTADPVWGAYSSSLTDKFDGS